MNKRYAILTSGKINTNSGNTPYFNIFENHTSDYPACMFLLRSGSKYMIVTGSGNADGYGNDWEVGAQPELFHDQTGRRFSQNYIVVGNGPLTKETLNKFRELSAKPYDKPKKGFGNKIYTKEYVNSCTFGVFK